MSSQHSNKRMGSCSTLSRACCTTLLLLLWGLVAVGVIYCHMAISMVVPALQEMPANLKKGFYEVLKFDSVSADAESVKNSAADALYLCNVYPSQCSNLQNLPATPSTTSNTAAQKQAIQDAFTRSLSVILKVATDEYFGTEAMNATATQLQGIISDLESIDVTTPQPCAGTNKLYCSIYENAEQIKDGADKVKGEVDQFCNTDEMQTWTDYAADMELLYALPYVLVVAMIFFTLFWFKDAACLCCGGSCCGSLAAIAYTLLWFIFFTFSLIVCVVGYVIRNKAGEVMIKGVFAKDVSLEALLNHIQDEYTAFWDVVFKDLVAGLEMFNGAFAIFVAVCLVVMMYALSVCCCRPYTGKKAPQDASQQKDGGVLV